MNLNGPHFFEDSESDCTRADLTSIIELQISKLYSREIGQFCLKHLGQDLKM